MTVPKKEYASPRSVLAAGAGSVRPGAERDSAQQSRPSAPEALQRSVENHEHARTFLGEWCKLLGGLVARNVVPPGGLGQAGRVDDADRTKD